MTSSEAFVLAHEAVDQIAASDPCDASEFGLTGYEHLLTDYGPDGLAARRELAASLVRAAQALLPQATGAADRQALQVMIERQGSAVELADAGFANARMDVLTAPPFMIRMAFELMRVDHDNVSARLSAVPQSLHSWQEGLLVGAAEGNAAARRQVLAVAEQVRRIGQGWFAGFAAEHFPGDSALAGLAAQADAAFTQNADWLEASYAPLARTADGVGEDHYRIAARSWLGDDIDPRETYAWGWHELRMLVGQARQQAAAVLPGADLAAAAHHLETSPEHVIDGTDALLRYLRQVTEDGFEVADRWFDINPSIRVCDVKLAGEGGAAAPYYTSPSEDLARPGCTWYPTLGKQAFPAWQLRSTWFHEAVPGHHLQLATVLVERETLSRFQRMLGWTSGYGEGWALYAERLMDELGAFEDPGSRLGFLAAQAMRAARIVVDIGLHLGLQIPGDNGLGLPAVRWTPELAVQVMQDFALLSPEFAASEVNRYLGLPGQAIAYKIGERVWLAEREAARARLGADFDLRDWHMYALRAGHMGLGPFRVLMSGYRR
jgi:uncharacterized protein (DUF885 family)